MINNYMAIIHVPAPNKNIASLTKNRPVASIPVGGSHRIIDFSLSNVVNAGIRNVSIISEEDGMESLKDHIGMGAEWDLARKKDGIYLFKQMVDSKRKASLDRVTKILEYFSRSKQKNIIVLSSNMICNIDIKNLIKSHEESKKEVTFLYKKVGNADTDFEYCDIVNIEEKKIIKITPNLGIDKEANISMEAYVMSKELFIKLLFESLQTEDYRDVKDLIHIHHKDLDVNLYEFEGCLYSIKTIRDYFKLNMDLLKKDVRKSMFGIGTYRRVYTKLKDNPPTLFKSESEVSNSIIANGGIISGKVKNSIISRKAVIEEDVEIENCIILQSCVIKSGSKLKNIIIDKNNVIEENTKLYGSDKYPLVIEKSINWKDNYSKNILGYIKRKEV